jgi:hypothetical protein
MNGGLDRTRRKHLLVASCETGRAVGGRAAATDRLAALVSRERRISCLLDFG